MAELAVTAIGADRPGIVATLAEVLRDRGGNILDSSMNILGGHFSMILLVEVDAAADDVRAALAEATDALDLVVTVTPVTPGWSQPAPTHVLSVYGADRRGVLAGVARTLADHGVNITESTTRMLSPQDRPVYAMVFQVEVPPDLDVARLDAALTETSSALEVDHTLRELDAETY